MKRVGFVLAVAFALGVLAGCASSPSGGTGGAKSATFNGVSAVDGTAGTADLSVSALDGSGKVLASGTISDPVVTSLSVSSASVASQASYTATASVCSNVTGSTGDLRALLTLDATGSMVISDPTGLRADAANQFVSRMAATDQAAVASFDSLTSPSAGYLAIHVWQDLTSDKAALQAAVADATIEGGLTNLWDAGVDSVQLIAGASGTNRLVVLLTDGFDNGSTKTSADVVTAATTAGVKVFTVGLGSSIDASALTDLATQTGGTFAQVVDAADLAGLFDGIFNATQAAGCIRTKFSPVPTSGTTLGGTLSFRVDGALVSVDFSVTFP